MSNSSSKQPKNNQKTFEKFALEKVQAADVYKELLEQKLSQSVSPYFSRNALSNKQVQSRIKIINFHPSNRGKHSEICMAQKKKKKKF